MKKIVRFISLIKLYPFNGTGFGFHLSAFSHLSTVNFLDVSWGVGHCCSLNLWCCVCTVHCLFGDHNIRNHVKPPFVLLIKRCKEVTSLNFMLRVPPKHIILKLIKHRSHCVKATNFNTNTLSKNKQSLPFWTISWQRV